VSGGDSARFAPYEIILPVLRPVDLRIYCRELLPVESFYLGLYHVGLDLGLGRVDQR
jgi:hypothetical protein